jgi:hypothetical protein
VQVLSDGREGLVDLLRIGVEVEGVRVLRSWSDRPRHCFAGVGGEQV